MERAARPRRTGGEFSDEGDSPSRRGLPLAAVNLLLLFFSSRSFLSPAPPQGPLRPLFFFHCAKLREPSPFFVRLPSIVSLFPVPISRFRSPPLFLPRVSRFSLFEVTDFHFARSTFSSLPPLFFFSPPRRANRATRNRGHAQRAFSLWELTRSTFWAKLSCTYRRCNLR